jgi:Cu/Ag efflux protein CusF
MLNLERRCWEARDKLPQVRQGPAQFLILTVDERIMKQIQRLVTVWGLAFLLVAACLAQTPAGKKPLTFHGKVEAVSADGITVNGEKVDGWMDAMTMKYKVDDPKVLKTVKPGDKITATVYEGDLSLHKVQVDGKTAK